MAVLRVSMPSPTASTAHSAPMATDAAIVPTHAAASTAPIGHAVDREADQPDGDPADVVPSRVMIAP